MTVYVTVLFVNILSVPATVVFYDKTLTLQSGESGSVNGQYESGGSVPIATILNPAESMFQETLSRSVAVSESRTLTIGPQFLPPPTYANVVGTVTDVKGTPLAGATVTCDGQTRTTKADGSYGFLSQQRTLYTVTASKPGYETKTATVEAFDAYTYTVNFALQSAQLQLGGAMWLVPPTLIGLLGVLASR